MLATLPYITSAISPIFAIERCCHDYATAAICCAIRYLRYAYVDIDTPPRRRWLPPLIATFSAHYDSRY